MTNNIVLIGMPGSGKTTIGINLAKAAGLRFLDSDRVIVEKEGCPLSEIIERVGDDGFRQVENDVNAAIEAENTVIATGGSVVYGREAMEHLRQIGLVVYLQLSSENLQKRLGDLHARGVTIKQGQTFDDLYRERVPLYEQYAHLTIPCDGQRIHQIVNSILIYRQGVANGRESNL